jgi:diketogulonate reductase-like aldo/keto reductase
MPENTLLPVFNPVTLHPAMTAQEIAAWCERYKMVVTIEYYRTPAGALEPLIHARRELAPFETADLPALLRRQAE